MAPAHLVIDSPELQMMAKSAKLINVAQGKSCCQMEAAKLVLRSHEVRWMLTRGKPFVRQKHVVRDRSCSSQENAKHARTIPERAQMERHVKLRYVMQQRSFYRTVDARSAKLTREPLRMDTGACLNTALLIKSCWKTELVKTVQVMKELKQMERNVDKMSAQRGSI